LRGGDHAGGDAGHSGAAGQADKVASATFFTAQVDFEKAGDLKNFIDDQQIATLQKLGPDGYLDGRYLAATFNLLRSMT
jgi:polyhydroxyalkanoate synthase